MAQYTLADGTLVEEDASGMVSVVSGPNGTPAPPPDTSIVTGFVRDVFGGLGAAIRRDFALAPAATPSPAPASNASLISPQLKQLLLYVGIGLLVYKILV